MLSVIVLNVLVLVSGAVDHNLLVQVVPFSMAGILVLGTVFVYASVIGSRCPDAMSIPSCLQLPS